MPQVISLGITYNEFWSLNPRIIEVLIKAQNEKIKNDIKYHNMLYHLQGHYFADALLATVGNMFNKGKKFEYPKEPHPLNLDLEADLDMADTQDREIAMGRVNFVAQLNNLFGDIERTLEDRNAEY